MPGTRTEHATEWICDNCIMVLANGDDSGRDPSDPEPLSLYPPEYDLTCGMMFSEHDEGCAYATGDSSAECACEIRSFSSATCDGCGDLPGARNAITVWWEATS